MSRGESDDAVADWCEGFEFGGEEYRAGSLPGEALVEGCDADGITGGDDAVFFFVVEDEGEHSVEVFWCIDAVFEVLKKASISHHPSSNLRSSLSR